jgi:hypothetical protein
MIKRYLLISVEFMFICIISAACWIRAILGDAGEPTIGKSVFPTHHGIYQTLAGSAILFAFIYHIYLSHHVPENVNSLRRILNGSIECSMSTAVVTVDDHMML